MRDLANRGLDRLAYAGFLVLFPGFVVYHYAITANWIPAFLGGLFGVTAALLAGVCLVHLTGYFQGRAAAVSLLEWTVLFVISYLLLWTFVAGAFMGDVPYAGRAVRESLATLLIWLGVYFVGSRVRFGKRESAVLLVAAMLIVGVLVHAAVVRQSFIGPFLEFQGARDLDNEASTYQSIGRCVLITAIVLAAVQSKFWKQLFVLLLTVVVLLAVGSRAHLIASVLLLAALVVIFMLRKRSRVTGMLFFVALLALSNVLLQLLLDTRASEIFNLDASTSWQARVRAQTLALDVLARSPFFGDFGYHQGHRSGYAHNALSAWAEYGALAFFLFVGLILYGLYLSAKRVVSERCTSLWYASFQLNLTALMLALGTESIFLSVFPPLAWGFTANALRDEARRKRFAATVLELAGAGAGGEWPRRALA